jgi:glycine/D-amino acid oxidase-like deaminating enzyme
VKVAEHSGHGDAVENPAEVNREIDPADRARVESFVKTHLPGLSISADRHCVCMYTMTPDEHFVLDLHPDHPQVSFAAGLSGHGFKFTPVLGAALADLALDGKTDLPISFLNSRRFSNS